jgi:hypothetical protein
VRKIKEPVVATASHNVLPLYCSAFFRPEAAFPALKAWVLQVLLDHASAEDCEANSIRAARAVFFADSDLGAA